MLIMANENSQIESELEDLETKVYSVLFNLRKLLSREKKLSAFTLTVKDLLIFGFPGRFKSSAKLDRELFTDKSCFQK